MPKLLCICKTGKDNILEIRFDTENVNILLNKKLSLLTNFKKISFYLDNALFNI